MILSAVRADAAAAATGTAAAEPRLGARQMPSMDAELQQSGGFAVARGHGAQGKGKGGGERAIATSWTQPQRAPGAGARLELRGPLQAPATANPFHINSLNLNAFAEVS